MHFDASAELPLYLFLGMLCGVVSVILTRLIAYWTRWFDFLKDRIGIPLSITPALGGLCTGLIALKYPGVLYWGFTNVDEILHSGKTASAPGAGLLVQLTFAKIIATSICRGSGLVGGVYAPSLFIGSAVGSVYGSLAGKAINAAIPDGVAHPQAYALVSFALMHFKLREIYDLRGFSCVFSYTFDTLLSCSIANFCANCISGRDGSVAGSCLLCSSDVSVASVRAHQRLPHPATSHGSVKLFFPAA